MISELYETILIWYHLEGVCEFVLGFSFIVLIIISDISLVGYYRIKIDS